MPIGIEVPDTFLFVGRDCMTLLSCNYLYNEPFVRHHVNFDDVLVQDNKACVNWDIIISIFLYWNISHFCLAYDSTHGSCDATGLSLIKCANALYIMCSTKQVDFGRTCHSASKQATLGSMLSSNISLAWAVLLWSPWALIIRYN